MNIPWFDEETEARVEKKREELLREIYPYVSKKRKIFTFERCIGRLNSSKKLKNAVFKLVAERPYLGEDFKQFLLDEFNPSVLEDLGKAPFLEKIALSLMRICLRIPICDRITCAIVRVIMRRIARHFVPASSLGMLRKNILQKKKDEQFSHDFHYLSEDAVLSSDIDDYKRKKIALIHALKDLPLRHRNISYKPSALIPTTILHYIDPRTAALIIKSNLWEILYEAQKYDVRITEDAETEEMSGVHDALREIILEDTSLKNLRKGFARQVYYQESINTALRFVGQIKKHIPENNASHRKILWRILKGAYWDTENLRAKKNRWPYYLYTDIYDTHAAFEIVTEIAFGELDIIEPAFALHNVFNQAYVVAAAEHFGAKDKILFQFLYNMGNREWISERQYKIDEYVSYGDEGADAFLGRRLLEDSANESVLQIIAAQYPLERWLDEAKRIVERKYRIKNDLIQRGDIYV